MAQNEQGGSAPGGGASPDQSGDFVHREKRAAEGLADDARAAAAEAGSQARKMASDKADDLQGAAASHLRTFADAVRSAGDELAEKEPGPVSDLVRQAAEGLERFSGALGRRSPGEMVEGVRDFGRQNPVGFLAGSMLAGFALARFASSTTPEARPGERSSPAAQRPAAAATAGGQTGFAQERAEPENVGSGVPPGRPGGMPA